MAVMHEIRKEELRAERAFLVGMGLGMETPLAVGEQLDELALLADTAGAVIVGRTVQMRASPDPKYFIGSGKAAEIKKEIDALKANMVVFNDELTPSQIRNLETLFGVKTIDRSMLILDIFAQHARTKEAKLQVELAQMHYVAPRLTRMWQHLGQQTGGVGTRRGPGEKQLEVDKRIVKDRIGDLNKKLLEVERQHTEGRKQRHDIFKAALVGYTNVGKSTLLNSLSKSKVYTANKLFATLDATTRRVYLPGYGEVLLSDTVGFIRKLPHHLVASFRTTLSVVTEADLILLVMDAASAHLDEQMEVVNTVLNELKTEKTKRLLVFNKTDKIEDSPLLERLKEVYPEAIFTSALQKQGMDKLKNAILGVIGRPAETSPPPQESE
jgi:GTPase